ncbi:MAG TPA: hypothetical protein PLZ15_00495 [Melioribacteraceae bacterium]|nr:hypothetical protein [Melioribacteraceae bacterium]
MNFDKIKKQLDRIEFITGKEPVLLEILLVDSKRGDNKIIAKEKLRFNFNSSDHEIIQLEKPIIMEAN